MPKKTEKVNLNFAIGLPPEKAIEYFNSKGYTFSWDWTDTWKEAHAKAFTVAKVMRMDILQDIRGAMQKAIEQGKTFKNFQDELEPILKTKGWWGKVNIGDDKSGKLVQLGSPWRLKTIYQTNLQTAYMAGRYKGMREMAAVRPYWQYVAVLDSKTRPFHRAINGRVYKFDDPFWDKNYPPNGFRCRCRVRALSEKNMKDRGLSISPSNAVPNITDAGWDYNPGKAAFEPDLKKYDGDIALWYNKVKYKPVEEISKVPARPEPSKQLEPVVPKGYARQINVKTEDDVKTVVNAFAKDHKDLFERGYKEVIFDKGRYLMATDCQGRIYISSKNSILGGFVPSKDMKSAMQKISRGQKLTFNEEYSLESLWHEIMHNRVKKYVRIAKGTVRQISMETLNQYVSRQTYPEFVKKLGGQAMHQADIIEKGYGYSSYVTNFRTLLKRAGVDEAKEIAKFQEILLDDYATIHENLAAHISKTSGKSLTSIKAGLNNLKASCNSFEKEMDRLGF